MIGWFPRAPEFTWSELFVDSLVVLAALVLTGLTMAILISLITYRGDK